MTNEEIVECWKYLENLNNIRGLLIGIYGCFGQSGGVKIKVGPQSIPTNFDVEGDTLLDAVNELKKKVKGK